jgi:hypothetical protein
MRVRGSRLSRALLVASACGALAGAADPDPPAAPLPPAIAALGLDAAQTHLWHEGLALETRESFRASNERYEALAAAHPESVFLLWHVARNHWRYGERLPVDAKEQRRAAFTLAQEWAERALARDPNCGECVFWSVVSMGRLATTQGILTSARVAKPMASLFERGIALQPTSRDNEWNTTLGNLYFAAAAFYRVLPDWAWSEALIGVRGDKDRALDYIARSRSRRCGSTITTSAAWCSPASASSARTRARSSAAGASSKGRASCRTCSAPTRSTSRARRS